MTSQSKNHPQVGLNPHKQMPVLFYLGLSQNKILPKKQSILPRTVSFPIGLLW
jgi:hypothetical protein